LKEYNKLIKEIQKNSKFKIVKTSATKATIKVVHIESGSLYSVHPGNNAVFPLRKWISKQEQL